MRCFPYRVGRRSAALMTGLLAAWLFWGSASANRPEGNILVAAGSLGGPSILVPESNYDFGEVDEGTRVFHDFIVENKGTAELAITKVSPDCGCTLAHFDRAIPAGGTGKIRLEVNLSGYKGKVRKITTVTCNDPHRPQLELVMQGTVRTLIDVLPANTLVFRGRAEKLDPKAIELVGGPFPFHITRIQSNLEGRVAHELETVEEGKRYRLKVSNLVHEGDYSGALWLHTDLPQKPYVMVRVTGAVEGEISVSPKTLFIGRLSTHQGVRSGSVLVIGTRGKPFTLTRLDHDESMVAVTQTHLPEQNGYRLEVKPKVENLSPGDRRQTVISIETDLTPGQRHDVTIHIMNTAPNQ